MLQSFEMTLKLVKCGRKKTYAQFPGRLKVQGVSQNIKEIYVMLQNLSCDPSSK